ncbi:MAG TPA: transposase [Usitatibacter sp.]|jgi:putative transposase|nr:transposase [Usitatibacter sp.]
MPRKPRLAAPEYAVHVIQRGNNKATCFVDDNDRLLYLTLLSRFAKHEQCGIHAYVLMTNHVHILATGRANGSISRLMKHIGENYVPRFNRSGMVPVPGDYAWSSFRHNARKRADR